MSGDRPVYDAAAARFFPHNLPDNVLATGGLVGDGSLDELVAHGRDTGTLAAGRAAAVAHRLQAFTARAVDVDGDEPTMPTISARASGELPTLSCIARPHTGSSTTAKTSGRRISSPPARRVRLGRTAQALHHRDDGPAQGKLETVNTVAVLAEARGETIAEVGTTVWRPPYAPITLGALGGRIYEPERVSSIHPWHVAHGATPDPGRRSGFVPSTTATQRPRFATCGRTSASSTCRPSASSIFRDPMFRSC